MVRPRTGPNVSPISCWTFQVDCLLGGKGHFCHLHVWWGVVLTLGLYDLEGWLRSTLCRFTDGTSAYVNASELFRYPHIFFGVGLTTYWRHCVVHLLKGCNLICNSDKKWIGERENLLAVTTQHLPFDNLFILCKHRECCARQSFIAYASLTHCALLTQLPFMAQCA